MRTSAVHGVIRNRSHLRNAPVERSMSALSRSAWPAEISKSTVGLLYHHLADSEDMRTRLHVDGERVSDAHYARPVSIDR